MGLSQERGDGGGDSERWLREEGEDDSDGAGPPSSLAVHFARSESFRAHVSAAAGAAAAAASAVTAGRDCSSAQCAMRTARNKRAVQQARL